jgi:hypothetical protein
VPKDFFTNFVKKKFSAARTQQEIWRMQQCWHVFSSTVHGQQLLQAWLSLLLTVDKVNITRPDKCIPAPSGSLSNSLRTAQGQLMLLVARDLQAHTDSSKCQQQQQQQVQGSTSSAAGSLNNHLPHPQLVSTALAWAKQYYGQAFRFDTVKGAKGQDGTPEALLALSAKLVVSRLLVPPTQPGVSVLTIDTTTGNIAVAASASTAAAAAAAAAAVTSLPEAMPCGDVVFDAEFDSAVTELLQALAGFVAAPPTGQGPTAAAWRELLALPSYGAAVRAINGRMQEYCRARDDRIACEQQVHQQQQQQQQQHPKTGKIKGTGGAALTAAGVELDKTPQQQQQARVTAQQAAASEEGSRIEQLLKRQLSYKQAVRVWALLCALAPSRHMCNGLLCRRFRTVSESFALVRGKACVCGCCVAHAAAHTTSKEAVCR